MSSTEQVRRWREKKKRTRGAPMPSAVKVKFRPRVIFWRAVQGLVRLWAIGLLPTNAIPEDTTDAVLAAAKRLYDDLSDDELATARRTGKLE